MYLWLGPPVFKYRFSFTLVYNRISHEYSSLFIMWLIWFLCFRFDALTEIAVFMRTEFLSMSVLSVATGPRVKLASCKSALNSPLPTPTPGGLFYWLFKGGCPGIILTLCCFVVYSTELFVLCLTLCYFVHVFFSPFSIAITSLGETRANLSAFFYHPYWDLKTNSLWHAFDLFCITLRLW